MEEVNKRLDKLESRMDKVEDKQDTLLVDVAVTKEVVLRLDENWKIFDNSRKDNFNKLSFQVIYIIISGVVGSIIGFITRGGK